MDAPEILKIMKMYHKPQDFSHDSYLKKIGEFPYFECVSVSIIIPCYNNIIYTLCCLYYVKQSNIKINYEIICIDDFSTDYTGEILQKIKGIRYHRNEKNSSFLVSCNKGVKLSRGKYVYLLNNDAFIFEDTIENLIWTFENFENVGSVGSKLIYPDGRLQEAGCIIYSDGFCCNYGRYKDQNHPIYNYVREVDYCSAASIMFLREDYLLLGGMDEMYIPGYYDETDLCMKIKHHLGKKNMYQPHSLVFHCEGTTHEKLGIKNYQDINREKFKEKWEKELKLKKEKLKIILFIDDYVPSKYIDSGSLFEIYIMKYLSKDYRIIHFSDNLLRMKKATKDLQKLGIECWYKPYLDGKIFKLYDYEYVFLNRLYIFQKYNDIFSFSKVIYYPHDITFEKEKQSEAIKNSFKTILVSKEEYEDVVSEETMDKLVISGCPFYDEEISFLKTEREGIVFLGNSFHPPNKDALNYFLRKISPFIMRKINIYIIGMSKRDLDKDIVLSENIFIFEERIEDLDKFLSSKLIGISPLRIGGGVKGKVIKYCLNGLINVSTKMSMDGIPLNEDEYFCCKTSSEFIEILNKEKLYLDIEKIYHKIRIHCKNNLEKIKETLK